MKRIPVYLILSVVLMIAWVAYEMNVAKSSGDPSAMAVFGFLPFLLPLFWCYAIIPTTAVAVVFEIGHYFGRNSK